jgi:hypothetical protein
VIDTPSGPRTIAELRVGDLVWSIDGGHVVAAPLIEVSSTHVVDHHVVRVLVDDGTELLLSPGHPLANGDLVGGLHAGDAIGSHRITSAELVPYRFEATHDILPATSTGTYFSHGIALGSTLGP